MSTRITRQELTEAYNQVAIWKTEAQYLQKRIEDNKSDPFIEAAEHTSRVKGGCDAIRALYPVEAKQMDVVLDWCEKNGIDFMTMFVNVLKEKE